MSDDERNTRNTGRAAAKPAKREAAKPAAPRSAAATPDAPPPVTPGKPPEPPPTPGLPPEPPSTPEMPPDAPAPEPSAAPEIPPDAPPREIPPRTPTPSPAPEIEIEPTTPAPEIEPTTPAPEIEPTTPAPEIEPTVPGPEIEPTVPGPEIPAMPETLSTAIDDDSDGGRDAGPPDLWDRAAAWAMQRGALAALGLVTLGMIILYAHMFRGELAGDDLTFHMAESARIADCLRAGDFDLWNPSANAGFASAYYYQVVPQLVSAIPAAVFGHHLFFFQLSVFLPLVLAPAAAYRGMRVMGATPWQAMIAALAIGFVNGESRWGTGNAGTFVVGLYTQTWALAAFPMALGHAVRWATQARGLAPAIAWGAFVTLCHPFAGVALGVALVAGWAAQLMLSVTDELFAALGRRIADPSGASRPAILGALAARWRDPPPRPFLGELVRLAILAVCLAVTWMPIWLPLVIDYAGFGGFPHRVNDEVGPGFSTLGTWYVHGGIFDFQRPVVLTWALPVVAVLARARFLRWLWAPALVYAVWLGLGPHIGKTDEDDLIPAVRFLGAMQVTAALAIGAGALMLLARLWDARDGSSLARGGRVAMMLVGLAAAIALGYTIWSVPDGSLWPALGPDPVLPAWLVRWAILAVLAGLTAYVLRWAWLTTRTQYGLRTAIAAGAAGLAALLVAPGARALAARVNVLEDYEGSHPSELLEITQRLQREPPGRKQVGTGAENHWWNLLSYEYGRRPSLLMMGGGGLQASPNYDFLWTVKDFTKNAWVYDAPILVFEKPNGSTMPLGLDVFDTKHYQVRRLRSPGLVSAVQVTGTLPPGRSAARAAAIDWLRTDLPLKDRVLAYAGSGGAGGEPHGNVARAVRQDSPGDAPDISAEVDATAPTTFMARESWHPRWHAYVDGVEAPVRRVTPDFPAVDVAAGHHVLTFRFERPWWAQAAWLVWPLLPLLAWLVTRRRRSSRGASPPSRA